MAARPLVCVVDDDESVREALPDFLAINGFDALAFASAEEFLDSGAQGRAHCLLLDIAMPGMSGPELYQELRARGHAIATIFISAVLNEDVQADLMSRGAVVCLTKPFTQAELRMALQMALGAA